MNIKILPYHAHDLESLLHVWERASRLAHPFLSDEFFDQERHNIPHIYLPHAKTWIVRIDDKLVGFIAMISNTIGGLFVDPDHHGNGLGYALVKNAEELYGDLQVDVFEKNMIGRQFYTRYGFDLIETKTWDDTGDILMHMSYSSPKG